MKKLFLGLSLVVSLVAAPALARYKTLKDLDDKTLHEMGLTREYCEVVEHGVILEKCVVLLDEVFEVELSEIVEQLNKETFSSDVAKIVRVGELIKPKMASIVTKAAQAIKNDMTKKKCGIVIALLRTFKKASAISEKELMSLLERFKDTKPSEIGRFLEEMTEQYAENTIKKGFEDSEVVNVPHEFQSIDLVDPDFAMLHKIACESCQLPHYFSCWDVADLPLNQCLDFVVCTLYSVSTAFEGDTSLDFSEWSNEVVKMGAIFAIMNPLCTQLLEALEQV